MEDYAELILDIYESSKRVTFAIKYRGEDTWTMPSRMHEGSFENILGDDKIHGIKLSFDRGTITIELK